MFNLGSGSPHAKVVMATALPLHHTTLSKTKPFHNNIYLILAGMSNPIDRVINIVNPRDVLITGSKHSPDPSSRSFPTRLRRNGEPTDLGNIYLRKDGSMVIHSCHRRKRNGMRGFLLGDCVENSLTDAIDNSGRREASAT